MKIRNFEELIDFIENQELTEPQINEVLVKGIGIISIEPFPKSRLVTRLRIYWDNWKFITERPIILETEEELQEA